MGWTVRKQRRRLSNDRLGQATKEVEQRQANFFLDNATMLIKLQLVIIGKIQVGHFCSHRKGHPPRTYAEWGLQIPKCIAQSQSQIKASANILWYAQVFNNSGNIKSETLNKVGASNYLRDTTWRKYRLRIFTTDSQERSLHVIDRLSAAYLEQQKLYVGYFLQLPFPRAHILHVNKTFAIRQKRIEILAESMGLYILLTY